MTRLTLIGGRVLGFVLVVTLFWAVGYFMADVIALARTLLAFH